MINNTEIQPGENQLVNIAVGKLPIGQRVAVKASVFNALEEGPVVLLMGGLHGDEMTGVEIIRRALERKMFEKLKCGSVIAISLMNIYGFLNFSRDLPDGKDVNRSFPGNSKGSLASRMASVLTKRILPVIDFGVDFHTGSALRYNYPQIRYNRGDTQSKLLAEYFNPPVLFEQATIAKSLRKTAKTLGKQILVFEGGESLRLDEYAIKVALEGIENLLIASGMLEGKRLHQNMLEFKKTSWIRASGAGVLNSFKKAGEFVSKGEKLGVISDPFVDNKVYVNSTQNGFLVGINNSAIVNQGDALFHIAYETQDSIQ